MRKPGGDAFFSEHVQILTSPKLPGLIGTLGNRTTFRLSLHIYLHWKGKMYVFLQMMPNSFQEWWQLNLRAQFSPGSTTKIHMIISIPDYQHFTCWIVVWEKNVYHFPSFLYTEMARIVSILYINDNNAVVLHNQCADGCWLLMNARRHGISRYGIDVHREYVDTIIRRRDCDSIQGYRSPFVSVG